MPFLSRMIVRLCKEHLRGVILSGVPPRFRCAILLMQNFDFGLRKALRMTRWYAVEWISRRDSAYIDCKIFKKWA